MCGGGGGGDFVVYSAACHVRNDHSCNVLYCIVFI